MIKKSLMLILLFVFIFPFAKDDPIHYIPGSYKNIVCVRGITISLNEHFSKEKWAVIPIAFIRVKVINEITASIERHVHTPDHQKSMNVIIEDIYYKDKIFDIDLKDKIILSVGRNFEMRPSYEYAKNDEFICIIYNTNDLPEITNERYTVYAGLHGENFTYKISDDDKYIYAIRGDFKEFEDVSLELSDDEINLNYKFKARIENFIKAMLDKHANYI